MPTQTFAHKIRAKTHRIVFVNALRTYLVAGVLLGSLSYGFFLLIFFFPASWPFRTSPTLLINLLIFLPCLSALGVIFFQTRNTKGLALVLEKHYPHLGNRLSTMLELSEKPAGQTVNPFSRVLEKKLEGEVNELLDRFRFGRAISWRKILLPFGAFLFLILAGIAHTVIQPAFFNRVFQRLAGGAPMIRPVVFFPEISRQFQIEVIPGNCRIAKGSHLLIKARIRGGHPQQVELRVQDKNQPGWHVLSMAPTKKQEYQVLLRHVMQPSSYFIQIGTQKSPIYKIKIFEPLSLQRTLWRLEFPSYMNLPDQRIDGWQEKMTVPRGIVLHLELFMNQPVSSGALSVEGGKQILLHMESPKKLTAKFTADHDLVLGLDITGKGEEPFWKVPPLWVQTIPDLDPYVEVFEPQPQNYVFPSQEVPFEMNLNDDYGITSVVLVVLCNGKEQRIDWLPKGPVKTRLILKSVLDLERFQLESRDFIVAHLEVKDNYAGDPPHIVRSPLFTFVIRDYVEQFKFLKKDSGLPSLRQLFEDVLAEQENIMLDAWDYLSMTPHEAPAGWNEPSKVKMKEINP